MTTSPVNTDSHITQESGEYYTCSDVWVGDVDVISEAVKNRLGEFGTKVIFV